MCQLWQDLFAFVKSEITVRGGKKGFENISVYIFIVSFEYIKIIIYF